MLEKRHLHSRFKVKLPVKFRVFDKDTKTDITNDVDAYTENVSTEGMCLVLPRGWDCPECNNCLGWAYNVKCKLKDSQAQEANRFLSTKLNLKILLSDPAAPPKEPIQLEGECVWVKQDVESEQNVYPVGVLLSRADKSRVFSYLMHILNP